MAFKYVIAVVRPEIVRSLEERLVRLDIGGITLSKVKGFGEYKNFYSRDWLTDHVKLEIFVEAAKLGALSEALRETTRSDLTGSGIVAVMPVEAFESLRAGRSERLAPAIDAQLVAKRFALQARPSWRRRLDV